MFGKSKDVELEINTETVDSLEGIDEAVEGSLQPGEEIEIKTSLDSEDDFTPEDRIRLPVGILNKGVNYRYVSIDEMGGVDEHLLDSPKAKQNTAIGSSLLICRGLQEIEGLIPPKKDPDSRFDASVARAMTQIDRDFVQIKIKQLSGVNNIQLFGICPRCDTPKTINDKLSELTVVEWPDDKPRYIEFELSVGITVVIKGEKLVCKKGKLRFPLGSDQEKVVELASRPAQMDALLAACVFDLEHIGKMNQAQAQKLKSKDRAYLSEIIAQEFPGIRPWKETVCDKCHKEFKLNMDMHDFFTGRQKNRNK